MSVSLMQVREDQGCAFVPCGSSSEAYRQCLWVQCYPVGFFNETLAGLFLLWCGHPKLLGWGFRWLWQEV